MVFTEDSHFVKDYIMLISEGLRTLDDVPDNLFNLKEVVKKCLEKQEED